MSNSFNSSLSSLYNAWTFSEKIRQLMTQFWNIIENIDFEAVFGCFDQFFSQKRLNGIFPEKSDSVTFLLHAKNWKKLMNQFWEKLCHWLTDKHEFIGPFRPKSEKSLISRDFSMSINRHPQCRFIDITMTSFCMKVRLCN